MKKIYLFFLSTCLSMSVFSQPEVAINEIASGFDRPVNIKHAGDERLFIVEQEGVIKILNADGTVNPTPFLDIQSLIITIGGIGDERGLLGLVFHPDYTNNGYFYVNYINTSGNTVVSRFSVSAGDPNLADAGSEFIIMTITQPFVNHNGGDMAFGPDGYLYIGTGDGGSGGDPQNHGQRLDSLLGKLLRIDVDGGSPYAIPSDNPFENDGNASTLGEIWAYGLRNPWKFSFDSLTGDLWIGDVGQGAYEEMNMVASTEAGLNYGWRCYEGNNAFNTAGCPAMNTLTFPVAEYSHTMDGNFKCSITGGYRYRGNDNPDFVGLYFFADYCSDEIGYAEYNGSSWDLTFSDVFSGNGWSAFGEDINGEIYIAGLVSGSIYKVDDANLGLEDQSSESFKMFPNPSNGTLTFEFYNSFPQELSVYDMQGKQAEHMTAFTSEFFSITTENLAKGLYIVEVLNTNGQKTLKKLIIN